MVEQFDGRVAAVRRFNRFYTRQIGVLEEGLAQSPFSLTEARVLYELAQRERPTAAELGRDLGLDAGYLSRILRGFEDKGLIARRPSDTDGRQSLVALTAAGRAAFDRLERATRAQIAAMLQPLSARAQGRLLQAMATIEALLSGGGESRVPYVLRTHQPGDLGWIVQRHGALYAEEYGFDETFEGLVAEIVAQFARGHDPTRERCWIAERDGVAVGSVMLVRAAEDVAKLRLLLVEPEARGLGIGARLVEECTRFARRAGYRTITLWTNSMLHAARRIYQNAGYRLVRAEPHHSFGHDLIGETWELTL
ncbi:MAG TPA: bifunctional helix-turn-helix transcriptional regulator/GNAT family N-acetyltransferase [Geminicoccaceae bacterium]|nr:bifunctional helix-turn-helix transcriptional regulator/GNAT family N-acetyltransferase [Geminicoccaceae bacterium]